MQDCQKSHLQPAIECISEGQRNWQYLTQGTLSAAAPSYVATLANNISHTGSVECLEDFGPNKWPGRTLHSCLAVPVFLFQHQCNWILGGSAKCLRKLPSLPCPSAPRSFESRLFVKCEPVSSVVLTGYVKDNTGICRSLTQSFQDSDLQNE